MALQHVDRERAAGPLNAAESAAPSAAATTATAAAPASVHDAHSGADELAASAATAVFASVATSVATSVAGVRDGVRNGVRNSVRNSVRYGVSDVVSDGISDCADADCTPFDTVGECCNGVDDNGNGIPDEFSCRCSTDADCAGGGPFPVVCWSATLGVCAPHCAALGGDTFCQMLDPSLTCSTLTGECTF